MITRIFCSSRTKVTYRLSQMNLLIFFNENKRQSTLAPCDDVYQYQHKYTDLKGDEAKKGGKYDRKE